jgi:uncharacterized coiled-coil protein SlyX
LLFPCVEEYAKGHERYADWLQWTENLMLDRSMYFNRPSETRITIPDKDARLVRKLFLLTHLRRVILQDAVALMDLSDVPFRYGDHGVFRHPVFAPDNQMFRKFKDDLSNSMKSAKSPTEDSLLANAPAIHSEFRTVHSSVQHLDHKLDAAVTQLKTVLENVVQQISGKVASNEQSMNRVYDFMEKMGNHMVRAARRVRQHPEKHKSPPLGKERIAHSNEGQGDQEQDSQDGGDHERDDQEQEDQAQPFLNGPGNRLSVEERLEKLESRLASRYFQVAPPKELGRVDRTMLPRSASLLQHWDEWFKGVEGRPSLWILNKTFKSKWRKGGGNTLTKTFSFKKAIITSVLRFILNEEAKGGTLDEREARALEFVIKGLNSGMTLNQYYLLLQKKTTNPTPERQEDRLSPIE